MESYPCFARFIALVFRQLFGITCVCFLLLFGYTVESIVSEIKDAIGLPLFNTKSTSEIIHTYLGLCISVIDGVEETFGSEGFSKLRHYFCPPLGGLGLREIDDSKVGIFHFISLPISDSVL